MSGRGLPEQKLPEASLGRLSCVGVDPERGWMVRDKVGRAYGFSVTNGQIVDPTTDATLYVAATIYTNANGVVGDGVYEYGRADRFFADLGEVLGRAFFGAGD